MTLLNLRARRRGQSTTEFALMIPIILALLFAVIEYAWYLGGIHYTNYATYAGARARQVGDSVSDVQDMLLTGVATKNASLSENDSSVKGTLNWEASMPGFQQVMGDMTVDMEVYLGPPECRYELTSPGGAAQYSDNKLKGGGC
jgi:Flp pilus assembly protein TadG